MLRSVGSLFLFYTFYVVVGSSHVYTTLSLVYVTPRSYGLITTTTVVGWLDYTLPALDDYHTHIGCIILYYHHTHTRLRWFVVGWVLAVGPRLYHRVYTRGCLHFGTTHTHTTHVPTFTFTHTCTVGLPAI